MPEEIPPELISWPSGPNLYLRWYAHRLQMLALAEKADQAPAESLLQQVWLYQRLLQDRLHTIDGRLVKILHPGFWNREPGPDFRRAVIQFESDRPITGDIEIDILPNGWEQHAHAINPAYQNVVLHVTWEPATGRNDLPTLPLKHALDSTLPELSFWLGLEPKPSPEGLAGQCSGPLRNLAPAIVADILKQAAQARLRRKAEQLQARARQAGWAGALWEGLFAALGYKRNVWPMRRIAQLLPMLSTELPDGSDRVLLLQARLLGTAGLLPVEPRSAGGSEKYLRRIWDAWWRETASFQEFILPKEIWNLGGIRPANHPQRRLACAGHWLAQPDFVGRIERWIERKIESPDLVSSLEQILQVPHDDFWSYRWTLRTEPFSRPQPLLGEHRITDLAVNVILPWLFLRAWAARNASLAATVESRYFLWPIGDDNSLLRLARQRLFGGVPARSFKTAAEQQGMLQITRDFCDYSNAVCHNCQFPDLLRAFVAGEKVIESN